MAAHADEGHRSAARHDAIASVPQRPGHTQIGVGLDFGGAPLLCSDLSVYRGCAAPLMTPRNWNCRRLL